MSSLCMCQLLSGAYAPGPHAHSQAHTALSQLKQHLSPSPHREQLCEDGQPRFLLDLPLSTPGSMNHHRSLV